MKLISKIFFAAVLLLVIGLSTGTAMACSGAVPIEVTIYSTDPITYECWGDGGDQDYPWGCGSYTCSNDQGGDGNVPWNHNTYGTCNYPLVINWGYGGLCTYCCGLTSAPKPKDDAEPIALFDKRKDAPGAPAKINILPYRKGSL